MTPDPTEIARTLLGVECYVALESEGPPQSRLIPGALGCTSRTLDLVLRDWLATRGEWFGRRPAIYVADTTIAEFAREQAETPTDFEQLQGKILAATISHELAHVAESEPDYSEPTQQRTNFAHVMAAYSIVVADTPPWPPMFGHSAHFIRNAVHLHYRAERLGWSFPVEFLFQGEQYGIAEPEQFAYALGDEPKCLEQESIFDVRKFRAPLNFVRLWQQSVWSWINQQPDKTSPKVVKATQLLPVIQED